ncbi:MAG: metallophosphoesterase [Chthoniobacterales bacterium]
MRTTLQKPAILWLTDLHLDRATSARRQFFYEEIQGSKADKILITGDISTSRQLPLHLRELAAAASPRPMYFVLGNHDYYGSSFSEMDGRVAGICRTHDNLQQLGKGEIIRLGPGTAMVGHRGWGDGRMGWGSRSFARNPDFSAIKDFEGLSREAAFALLGQLGQESASYLRGVLPYALTCWQHVIVATHVPPFTGGACFSEKPCDWLRQPYYSNIAMGGLLLRMAECFPKKRITILAGHTHCAAQFQAAPNLELRVGGARPGFPKAQRQLSISSHGMLPNNQMQSQQ